MCWQRIFRSGGPEHWRAILPYYITSPIIDKFVRLDGSFPRAVFLMQWEVAERLLANPGSRSYGYLTVATRLFCDVELIAKVPSSAFVPPPQVDSGAVLLRRRPGAPARSEELLRFVRRCFAQKRKTLRNNLRPMYGAIADSFPEAQMRAEQLSLEQFLGKLHERLSGGGRNENDLYTEGS